MDRAATGLAGSRTPGDPLDIDVELVSAIRGPVPGWKDVVVSKTMLAALLTGFGGPEALQVRDGVAVPSPGAGQVCGPIDLPRIQGGDIVRADDEQAPVKGEVDAGWERGQGG